MKKTFIAFLTLLFVSVNLFSSINFSQVDDLYFVDEIAQTKSILDSQLNAATNNKDKAEIYWRLARVQVNLGDKAEGDSNKLEIYDLGLEYANKSIELFNNPLAHLWKSSNVGRIGQTKGILKSLSAANDMRDDLRIIFDEFNDLENSEAWYVLGMLYNTVPGGFISFGNNNYGISYYRRAIDTIPSNVIYPNHFKETAIVLYDRNWNKNKRTKEFKSLNSDWKKESKPYDKYAYYEGMDSGKNTPYYSSVPINKMSDRQEAVMLLNYAVAKYNVWPTHTAKEIESIAEIKDLISKWT
jgi:tetratricopeptide (TPR) repeat protein